MEHCRDCHHWDPEDHSCYEIARAMYRGTKPLYPPPEFGCVSFERKMHPFAEIDGWLCYYDSKVQMWMRLVSSDASSRKAIHVFRDFAGVAQFLNDLWHGRESEDT